MAGRSWQRLPNGKFAPAPKSSKVRKQVTPDVKEDLRDKYRQVLRNIQCLDDITDAYADVIADIVGGDLDPKAGEVIRKLFDSGFETKRIWLAVRWPEQLCEQLEALLAERDGWILTSCEKLFAAFGAAGRASFKKLKDALPNWVRLDRP